MPNKLIKANDGTVIGASFFAVGSVQQTFLSAVEFESIMGSEWVLADGRDVTGSLYETITGNTTVPDCRGLFLRTVGGNADPTIGGTQSDATASNGLGFVKSDSGGVSAPADLTDLGNNASARAGGGRTDDVLNITRDRPFVSQISDTLSIGSNDSETRPVNITVNTYIKIN